ncbi:MAG: hypothetical protein AB1758_19980, partial [Candidatus Eremiobacterota bacterium]
MLKSLRRGIVLITSIVLAVVMIMFVSAAISLGPGNLASGQLAVQQAHAQRAAQSGIDYCLARMRLDPAWKGDTNQVTINRPDLVVEEDQGNVFGLVRAADGQWSQFRVRFNFQDGAAGPDGLDDPTTAIQNPYVSFNNLMGAAPADVLRADQPGYAVSAGSQVAFVLPTWGISVAAEGRAGLRGVNPAVPSGDYGGVATQVVEAVYQIPGGGPAPTPVQPAGSMAGKDFLVELDTGQVNVTSTAVGDTPRVRTKGQLSITGGGGAYNYVSPQGEVRTSSGTMTGSYDSAQVTVVGEAAMDPYYQLAWSEVKKAPATGPKIQAGTYVWWEDGTLHYYDMSFTDYATYIQGNPTDPGVSPI